MSFETLADKAGIFFYIIDDLRVLMQIKVPHRNDLFQQIRDVLAGKIQTANCSLKRSSLKEGRDGGMRIATVDDKQACEDEVPGPSHEDRAQAWMAR